jgi:diacylglycerol kinase family enzyme
MLILIANPSSRAGKGKSLWTGWERSLRERGISHVWYETASLDDCGERAFLACRAGATPVAVGGDGTINAVADGVLRAGGQTSMGVLYAGTSPDFCRFHGIPADGGRALDALLAGRAAQVDAAAVSFADSRGAAASGHFVCACNIGLGSATAAFANRWRKILGDGPGTGLGLVRAMLRHRPFACRIDVDGESFAFQRANHIMILKSPYIASGLRVTPGPEPADGGLLALVIHDKNPAALLALLPAAYAGTLAERSGVFARRCAAVRVETTPAQPVEFDGDARGTGPVSIRVLPGVLSLIAGNGQGACHA